jgi:hypothetical protein
MSHRWLVCQADARSVPAALTCAVVLPLTLETRPAVNRGNTTYQRYARAVGSTTAADSTQGTRLARGVKVSIQNTVTASSLTRCVNQGVGEGSTQHLHNDDATREAQAIWYILAVAAKPAIKQQEPSTRD